MYFKLSAGGRFFFKVSIDICSILTPPNTREIGAICADSIYLIVFGGSVNTEFISPKVFAIFKATNESCVRARPGG